MGSERVLTQENFGWMGGAGRCGPVWVGVKPLVPLRPFCPSAGSAQYRSRTQATAHTLFRTLAQPRILSCLSGRIK